MGELLTPDVDGLMEAIALCQALYPYRCFTLIAEVCIAKKGAIGSF